MAELLIDGYNLIRQVEGLAAQERRGGLAAGREALIRRLSAYRRTTGHKVVVVFDGDDGFEGTPKTRKSLGITVVFSRPPKSADEVIVSRIARSHGKKALRVVSSDRVIRRAARQHKIASVRSEAFAEEMATARPPAKKSQAEESGENDVAYWMQVFETEKGMFEEED